MKGTQLRSTKVSIQDLLHVIDQIEEHFVPAGSSKRVVALLKEIANRMQRERITEEEVKRLAGGRGK